MYRGDFARARSSTRSRPTRSMAGECPCSTASVVGEVARTDTLLATARKLPHGTSIVLHAPSADVLSATHPVRAKLYAATDGAAFVCRGQSCSLPVTEPDVLVQMVASPAATVEPLNL